VPISPAMDAASSIIARLGGPVELAGRFGISPKAIEMWERRSRIPGKWHLELLKFAAERGVKLSPDELLSTQSQRAA
jgi:hypothetical protein